MSICTLGVAVAVRAIRSAVPISLMIGRMAVLRTEIMPPLRNTVRLVDGVERNLDLAQKRHVILFGERLRSEVEQLGPPLQHIVAHLRVALLFREEFRK